MTIRRTPAWPVLVALSCGLAASAGAALGSSGPPLAAPIDYPSLGGIPIDFFLFAFTLAGIALFHHHTLAIALGGLVVTSVYKILFSPFQEGPGVTGWTTHLGHEWVLLANLLGLLLGFALLSKHFEESRVPAKLPH